MKTIKLHGHGFTDNFMRPVEWTLHSIDTITALILIAEEAEIFIPILRAQKIPAKVHLITYSALVMRKMLHSSDLKYFALLTLLDSHVVPYWLTIELGIFTGRLYIDFEECALLVEHINNGRPLDRGHAFFAKHILGEGEVMKPCHINGIVDGGVEEEGDEEDEWDGADGTELT
ncbi:hypothetical protein GQ44DRAFT_723785 [Phaeosphaeriaceae sp. PMI808]|nr:hypothetical protein GQ44DRAFT_723785 [Phaeosphaeriaceae sp. PMI808]